MSKYIYSLYFLSLLFVVSCTQNILTPIEGDLKDESEANTIYSNVSVWKSEIVVDISDPDAQLNMDYFFKENIISKNIRNDNSMPFYFDKEGNMIDISSSETNKIFIKGVLIEAYINNSYKVCLAGLYKNTTNLIHEIIIPRTDHYKVIYGKDAYQLEFFTNTKLLNTSRIYHPKEMQGFFTEGSLKDPLYVAEKNTEDTVYYLINPDATKKEYRDISVDINDQGTLKSIFYDQIKNNPHDLYVAHRSGNERFIFDNSLNMCKDGIIYKKFIKACIIKINDTGYNLDSKYTIGGVYEVVKADDSWETPYKEELIAFRPDRVYPLYIGSINKGDRSTLDIYIQKDAVASESKTYNPDDVYKSYDTLDNIYTSKELRRDYLLAYKK